MPRVHKRPPGARKYTSYDDETIKEAVIAIKSKKMSLRMAHCVYKIPTGTLSHKVNLKHNGKVGHPTTFSANEEAAFVSHMKTVALWGFPFDTLTTRTCQNIKLNRARVSAKEVATYFNNLEKTLNDEEEILLCNLFNYDKTNLCDNPGVKKCIFKRVVKYAERIKYNTKASISIMYCGSATGALLPCYVVYKLEHLWST